MTAITVLRFAGTLSFYGGKGGTTVYKNHEGYAGLAGNGVYAGGTQLLVVDYIITFFNATGTKTGVCINYTGF